MTTGTKERKENQIRRGRAPNTLASSPPGPHFRRAKRETGRRRDCCCSSMSAAQQRFFDYLSSLRSHKQAPCSCGVLLLPKITLVYASGPTLRSVVAFCGSSYTLCHPRISLPWIVTGRRSHAPGRFCCCVVVHSHSLLMPANNHTHCGMYCHEQPHTLWKALTRTHTRTTTPMQGNSLSTNKGAGQIPIELDKPQTRQKQIHGPISHRASGGI